jgi:hypothetical protein
MPIEQQPQSYDFLPYIRNFINVPIINQNIFNPSKATIPLTPILSIYR